MFVRAMWSKVVQVQFIDFPYDLIIVESRVLKSFTIIALPFISLLVVCLLYIFRCFNAGCANIYNYYALLVNWPLYRYIMTFFVSCGPIQRMPGRPSKSISEHVKLEMGEFCGSGLRIFFVPIYQIPAKNTWKSH